MKKQALLFALVMILGSVLTFSTGALAPDPLAAAPGGAPGSPGGNGGGGGGGGGGEIPDYGDLIILYRDAYGVPIPSYPTQVPDPETGELVDGGLCWQPIAFNVDDVLACPDACQVTTTDPTTVLVDQYTCGVATGCSGCTQEADFGRLNEARSPEDVFESQLEDVVTALAIADSTSLDPAGRMVASTCPPDVTKTIDSPLQNLAIYRQLMLTGDIGTPLPQGADPLGTAARGLGAASDKSGGFNVDMLAYLNSIMGLDETTTLLPKLCETYREEVQGVIEEVEKCFLDYTDYGYNRGTNFGALPSPAYIPANEPVAGWFEYQVQLTDDPPTFGIEYGPVTTAVFADEPGFLDGNIGGFAQASDDTRAVIDFMHTDPVPVDYVTAVPCEGSGDIKVDVSISDVSGLQVPKNVRDGSSDREFIVTVANAGPDLATVTLTVTAQPAVDGAVEADLVGDDPDAGFIQSPFEFPAVDIPAGGSKAFSAAISVEIGQGTTIDWTASAAAEFDVNLGNNEVNEVSNVKVTGGGRGGGKPLR